MSTVTENKVAARLLKAAAALTPKIEKARRPMTQAATHKRLGEYRSRLIDGERMDRTRQVLLKLADLEQNDPDAVPLILRRKLSTEEVRLGLCRSMLNTDHGMFEGEAWSRTDELSRALQAIYALAQTTETAAQRIERERLTKIAKLEDGLRFQKIQGFFPTPSPTIDTLLAALGGLHNCKFLEPSAGTGAIADEVRKRFPTANVRCVERLFTCCEILTLKGYEVHNGLFEEWDTIERFDAIGMNPPFENGMDGEHVMRAWDLLMPGGRLAAIVGAGIMSNSLRRSVEFREWMAAAGLQSMKLPEDSFNTVEAFRRTGVQCYLVWGVRKPNSL
jgi:16S rRNA G1207 methylase RsmC